MMPRVILVLALLAFLAAGCGEGRRGDGTMEEQAMPTRDINSVMNDNAMEFMAIPGVTAVAVGRLESGEPCIRIYVEEWTDELKAKLPATVEGHPVDVEVSGEIRPLGAD